MLSVLGIIIQLRKCCNHPNLFEPRPVISPLVVNAISTYFPSTLCQPMANSDLHYLHPLTLNTVSSQLSWSFFRQLFDNNQIPEHDESMTAEEPLLPPLSKFVKFVTIDGESHFYRNDITKTDEKVNAVNNNLVVCNGENNVSLDC